MKLARRIALYGLTPSLAAQEGGYTGLTSSLENLYRVARAKTFSISPRTDREKGKRRHGAQGSASARLPNWGRAGR